MKQQPPSSPTPDLKRIAHQGYCRDRDEEFRGRFALLERAVSAPRAGQPDPELQRLLSNVSAVIGQVHQQGYCIVPELMGSECLERLRHGLGPLLAQSARAFERGSTRSRTAFHVHNVLAKSRAADEVALHPMIRTTVGAVLGFDFIFHAGAIVTANGPGCLAQPLHRDDASYYALPRPRMPLVVTVAVALDDFTAENGATRLVPSSCWWERDRVAVASDARPVEMPAGSVLFWDGATFHGGGANTTRDSTRRTLLLSYTRGWLRTQVNQFLAVPRAVVLSLPAELQRELGYAHSQRALGECDGQEPIDYLRAVERQGDGTQAGLGPESMFEK